MTLDELKVYIGTRIKEFEEDIEYADGADPNLSYLEGALEAYEHLLSYIEANE